jgi:nitrate reductase delta subunit
MKTLKALSALLNYPTPELVAAVPAIRELVASEGVISPEGIEPLLAQLQREDIYDLQESYILLFDRTRSLSLHLFEHVHGESRDRGQAMVDLKAVYAAAGFEIDTTDLPDFIPLFLEYCSLLPRDEARLLLAEPAHVLTAMAERLAKKASAYAPVFTTLVALAAAQPAPEAFEALVPEEDFDPNDLKALDAVWEEEEVRFGPGAATAECGVDSLAAKVRQARRPAPGVEVATSAKPRTVFTHSSPRA